MTLNEFNKGFKMLLAYYPNTKNVEDLSQIYFLALSELNYGDFSRAIGRIVKEYEGEFLPKIPTILKYARSNEMKLDIETQIELAKKLLSFAMTRHGRYSSIAFEDKGINAVIDRAGGWEAICSMDMDKYRYFLNNEFPRTYKAYIETGFQTSDVLIGIHDFENGSRNVKVVSYSDIGVDTGAINLPKIEFRVEVKSYEIDYKKLKNKLLVGG